jgi:hypothetical protein
MKNLLLALALVALTPVCGFAGEIANHAAAAEKALDSGDGLAAIQEFDAAQDALWTAMPLTVKKVEKAIEASGVGIYTPRPDAPYKPGEKLYLYLEPVGYGYGDDGLGNKVIELSVELTLSDDRGQALGTIENIAAIRLVSRVKNRELFFGLDLSLDPSSVPAGKYRGDFVMHDKNSDKTAKFSVDFQIAG